MEDFQIMLVDDEPRFLETTKKLLAREGFDVLTSQSGQGALELLNNHNVDVVVLDVKMPGMDGMETLKAIKRQYPLTEVIVLTGHATVESAVMGLKSGAADYLMKPVDITELLDKARQANGKRCAIEEKIRVMRTRVMMKSPREIIRAAETEYN